MFSWIVALSAVSNWRAQEPAVGLGQLLGLQVHPQALGGARRQDHLGAEEAHHAAALDGERVGHRHDQRIALGGADHRQPDAGVAARRLDHRLPRLEFAAALGLLDDADREAVLDRPGRIEELGLHVQPHVLRRDAVEADARRVADGVDDAVVEASAAVGRA